jgi:5-methylcytosine-specific restriction endonuclease McrA
MTKTLKQRQRKKQRKATYKYFHHLLVKAGNKCTYCDVDIIRIQNIRRYNRIKITAYEITYRHKDKVITKSIASLDHVKPLSEGGTKDVSNVVVSCVRCNQTRNIDKQKKGQQ